MMVSGTQRGGAASNNEFTTKDTETTKIKTQISETFVTFALSFENTGRRDLGQFKQNSLIVSFQHGVLESRLTWMFPEASLRIWMPAIHAGMTNLHFHIL